MENKNKEIGGSGCVGFVRASGSNGRVGMLGMMMMRCVGGVILGKLSS